MEEIKDDEVKLKPGPKSCNIRAAIMKSLANLTAVSSRKSPKKEPESDPCKEMLESEIDEDMLEMPIPEIEWHIKEEVLDINLDPEVDTSNDEAPRRTNRKKAGYPYFRGLVDDDESQDYSPKKKAKTGMKYKKRKRSHECDICGKPFPSMDTLKSHFRTHTGEKPWECKDCDKCFAHRSNLIRHKLLHEPKQFPCDMCQKSFISKARLQVHKLVHTDYRPFPCSVCGKGLRTFDRFQKHLQRHASAGETKDTYVPRMIVRTRKGTIRRIKCQVYRCEVCERDFSTRQGLKSHYLTHTGERPLSCEMCGKRFAHFGTLIEHRLSHLPKTFQCDTCHKMFASEGRLASHQLLHTNAERPHVCPICNSAFYFKKRLGTHMKIHTEEKTLECEDCGKKFHRMYQLELHSVVHSDERPFRCDECGQYFKHRHYLNIHYKEVHKRARRTMRIEECMVCGKFYKNKAKLQAHAATHEVEKLDFEDDISENFGILVGDTMKTRNSISHTMTFIKEQHFE